MTEPDSDFQSLANILHELAHDIKQPVRGIRNYVQYLSEDYADHFNEKGKDMLDTLERLSLQIEAYVSSMLDGAYGDEDLDMEDVDLNEVLESVQELLLPQIQDTNAEIVVADNLPVIRTNRSQLSRVFLNLIANALKYNNSDIPRVEITLNPEPSDSATFECCIKDNGIGISESEIHSIFEPSVRPNAIETVPGLGMGLTLTRLAVAKLGGRIWAESTPDLGTTMRFTIPMC